jgi:hypothetical protein
VDVFSVQTSITDIVLPFSFFPFVAHNENWHEKLEMTEEQRTTLLFFSLVFCTVSFSFCLMCGKTHRHTLSVERAMSQE